MKPKDLKNPKGVKSTENPEKKTKGKVAASEEQAEEKRNSEFGEEALRKAEEEIELKAEAENEEEAAKAELKVQAGEAVQTEVEKAEEEPEGEPDAKPEEEVEAGVKVEAEKEAAEAGKAAKAEAEVEKAEEEAEGESEEETEAGVKAEAEKEEEVKKEPDAEPEEEAESEIKAEKVEPEAKTEVQKEEEESDAEVKKEAKAGVKVEAEKEEPEEEPDAKPEEELEIEEKAEAEEEDKVSGRETPEEKKELPAEQKDSGEEKVEAEKELTPAALTSKKEKVAGHAEKQPEPEAKKEKPDYASYSQIELVNALRKVLDSNGDHDIKDEVEEIKSVFYKQLKEEIEAQKNEFIQEGGDEEEFVAEENPYEQDIKELLKRYRHLRHEFNKKMDLEKEVNLQEKYAIIEEIKGLINKEESINKTFQEFRDLQQRWREIGLVPQSKMKDLWDTYHFHVENFYDYIKINKELRDLDLKKNLEMKIRLCEQAEELLLESNTIKAFNQLQKLHERWREIGPVPRENKDDIWERFKASTAKINRKHQEYFENRKSEQRENLEAKRALCEQVEEINKAELATHKDWAEKSKEVINLQKVWRTIGFAPHKDNNRIYKRFREACDSFFDAKREFYSKNKELQQNNLQIKTDLCMQAEALKDSTDWYKTTQDLINIQKQWKETGPVPRKISDALWRRFRAACDYFFGKKSEYFSNVDSEQEENLKQKEQIIHDVENYEPSEDADENLNALKDFQRRWTEIGHVPIRKKEEVQKKYREAIDKLFDDLNLDESKRNLLKFRTKMASFSESSHGQNKMRMERDKYMTRMKQLESDLVLLDNNIGFFAKSKNAETLIKDVKKKIEQTRRKIELLKDKIRVIDEMDQSEE
jgi:hypothetical protein